MVHRYQQEMNGSKYLSCRRRESSTLDLSKHLSGERHGRGLIEESQEEDKVLTETKKRMRAGWDEREV